MSKPDGFRREPSSSGRLAPGRVYLFSPVDFRRIAGDNSSGSA